LENREILCFIAWTFTIKHQSGKSNKKPKKECNTQAGQIIREAAQSIANSKHSALSGFYRKIKAKKGGLVANKATARKIAIIFTI